VGAPEYLNFDLALAPSGPDYIARVLDSPRGEAEATVTMPFDDDRLENVILKLGRTRSGVRRIGSPQQDLARAFGSSLYDAVFTAEVGTCFRRSLDEADRRGKGLRIRLRLTDAPALAVVPWEYLFPTGLRRFLVLSSQTPLVRYLDLPRVAPPLAVAAPLRALLVVSGPKDLAVLDTSREVENLRGAVRELTGRGLLEIEPLPTPTLGALRHALRRGEYHILHFIGHGDYDERSGDGVLALEDDLGLRHIVTGSDLGTLLHDHRTLRLAVLNACEGARSSPRDPFSGVAQSLMLQGLPAVVAMQFEITDAAAIAFSHEFYAAVADGYPIDAALADGRKAIFGSDNDVEWGTPVLYLRADDGRLFDVATGATAPASSAAPPAEPQPPPPVPPTGPMPVQGPAPEVAAAPTRRQPARSTAAVRGRPSTEPPYSRGDGSRRRRAGLLAGSAAAATAVLIGLVALLNVRGDQSRPTTSTSPTVNPAGTAPAPSAGAPTESPSPSTIPSADLIAVRGTATVDGAATEWAGVPVSTADTVVAGRDSGLRARWRLMWDDRALYALVEVRDSDLVQPNQKAPAQLWRGDSVHLELGPGASGLGGAAFLRATDAHYLFGPMPGTQRVVTCVNPASADRRVITAGRPDPAVRAVARLSGDGYVVEAAIPWESTRMGVPRARSLLAANLNASDGSADGTLVSMVSTNPARSGAAQPHPGRWQTLVLQ
jgi:hypothetical protein